MSLLAACADGVNASTADNKIAPRAGEGTQDLPGAGVVCMFFFMVVVGVDCVCLLCFYQITIRDGSTEAGWMLEVGGRRLKT